MMRTTAALLMLGLTAAAPASDGPFAISCNGTASNSVRLPGSPDRVSSAKLRNVIYVIDEEARTVHQPMSDGKRFDETCPAEVTCSREFSATRIRIAGERAVISKGEVPNPIRRVVSFDWDRRTNRVETVFDLHATRGVSVLLHTSLSCKPAKLPAGYVARTNPDPA